MEDFKGMLQSRGFRATPGRIALLRTLYLAKHPLTVEEIARKLDLNVVTLYRALNDLADQNLLLRGIGHGDAMHFSYPKNHHHHLVCADCGFTASCAVC
jgi:Fe2+ or Zn2+ uptake regulation protein